MLSLSPSIGEYKTQRINKVTENTRDKLRDTKNK